MTTERLKRFVWGDTQRNVDRAVGRVNADIKLLKGVESVHQDNIDTLEETKASTNNETTIQIIDQNIVRTRGECQRINQEIRLLEDEKFALLRSKAAKPLFSGLRAVNHARIRYHRISGCFGKCLWGDTSRNVDAAITVVDRSIGQLNGFLAEYNLKIGRVRRRRARTNNPTKQARYDHTIELLTKELVQIRHAVEVLEEERRQIYGFKNAIYFFRGISSISSGRERC
ncbi:PREDICTED: uncharacterized protein LOC104749383 isoform X1 [Camelina sativa]|uniref:Uncharacterized protein LOC104749383 isoform X1 n=1 Tax=Camelina sativa TaxID=90675 RepID=A0ABM0WCZ3_CAMSA|nr:PREDICTED: uncharacterized protein LOC104749383 isoform X2 [Camelina sativa]XP_019093719.1 PREDICTED: uncharacterized protein LOC104749383 isoform X1 [Camelina sativa]